MQDFTCCRSRHFIAFDKDYFFGTFIGGELYSTAVLNVLLTNSFFVYTVFEGYDGHDLFAPLFIRQTNAGAVKHALMASQDLFHFAGVDIFSTSDDHIVFSVYNVVIAFFVLPAQITRGKPAVFERFEGFFRQFIVFVKEHGAPGKYFSHLAVGNFIVFKIQKFYEFGAENLLTDGTGSGYLILGLEHGDDTGFRGAIAFIQFGVGEKGHDSLFHLLSNGR